MMTTNNPEGGWASSQRVKPLLDILMHPDDAVVSAASQSGDITALIPAWGRLTQLDNTQHRSHHFALDTHTLKVLAATKASPYFAQLTQTQQHITVLAALLHDIAKYTGPQRLQQLIPVDKLHPIKSAEQARHILQDLGLPMQAIQQIYSLIHHHQIIGRLFIFYPGGAPDDVVSRIALKIRSRPLLTCLLALSQGDISGVQDDNAFFTREVAEQMAHYAHIIQDVQRQQHAGQLPLEQQQSRLFWPCHSVPEQAAVQDQLHHGAMGGAVWLPYGPMSLRQQYPHRVEVQVSQDNIAAVQARPQSQVVVTPQPVEMHDFYSALTSVTCDSDAVSPWHAWQAVESFQFDAGVSEWPEAIEKPRVSFARVLVTRPILMSE